MKLWIPLILIVFLLAMVPEILPAAEDVGHNWRARSSVVDIDSYSETDTDEEVRFGREISARLLGQFRMSGNEALQRYVNLVGLSLAQNCSRPELDFHFVVIESAEINAYSTPGGYVFVTTAILAKMENEAELAGVLAHEITHVTERHIVKELGLKGAELSGATSIVALISGASESVKIAFSHTLDKAVDLILRDGYKKEDEMQADAGAALLCALSGYDPSALVTFLDKAAKIKSGVGKTYPMYDVRLSTIQKAMSDAGVVEMKLVLNPDRFIKTMRQNR